MLSQKKNYGSNLNEIWANRNQATGASELPNFSQVVGYQDDKFSFTLILKVIPKMN